MSIKYSDLISKTRLRSRVHEEASLTSAMLSDKVRIITATAFRRLQTKAQVFSLERNAAVRSRLTHTLEVSVYGQLIAEKIIQLLSNKGSIDVEYHQPFITTIENACLLHDVGNPPFGHLGEFAIRDWFEKNSKEIRSIWGRNGVRGREAENYMLSFTHFDGNPQGFRIITRLQWLNDEFGLNLTCTLLASIIKYLTPYPTNQPFGKKSGYFQIESDIIERVWTELKLKYNNGKPLQRHPFAYIMEAADDIAYSMSDIEDAIEKNIISEDYFFNSVPSDLRRFEPSRSSDTPINSASNARFVLFRTQIAGYLVEKAAETFSENEEAILSGDFHIDLLSNDGMAKVSKQFFQRFAKDHIYTAREAVYIELGGHRIINSILNRFMSLIELSPSEFWRLHLEFWEKHHRYEKTAEDVKISKLKYGELSLERRLYTLLPNKHLLVYEYLRRKNPSLEPVLRTHLILDYLTGMTDGHVVQVYNILNGTSEGLYI